MKRIVLSFAALALTFPLATSAQAGWRDNQSPIVGRGAISVIHNQPAKHESLPKGVNATDVVNLYTGENQTLAFEQPISRIGAGVEGVVAITPSTDQIFTLKGLAPGQTIVVAQTAEGVIVRRLMVNVSFEKHLVRVYKLRDSKDDKDATKNDYDGYQCNGRTCGRANVDMLRLEN